MAVKAKFPVHNTQLGRAAPGTPMIQTSGTVSIANRTIPTPSDGATLKVDSTMLNMYPSMQDPSSVVGQLNNAGVPATIDVNGLLTLTGTNNTPTSNDINVLRWLGFI
jgi:hypothetical protein